MGSSKVPSTYVRLRVLLSQLGIGVVLAFAVLFFVAGFLCRSYVLSSGEKAPGGRDPCANVNVDPALGVPRRAAERELVLVTGAAGFIGSTLVEQLLELDYRVRAFDNLETGNIMYLNLRHPRLEFMFGDIIDKESVRRAMDGVVGVFHLAAASKVLPSLKSPTMATFNIERNAVGTSNVLEVANATGIVRKVVFAASSTYYGNQPVPFVESDGFAPSSPYAASKYMGELQMLTNDHVYRMPTISLRFFMVYGQRNPEEGAYAVVTGKFLRRRREGKPLVIEGSGAQFRDFVHVEDISRACILGFQSPVHGVTVNVGTGAAHSVQEVADLVSSNQEHVAPRANDLLGTLADTCQAKRLLHFQARKDFVPALRGMLERSLKGDDSSELAAMWLEPRTSEVLEQRLPGWAAADRHARGHLVRDGLREDPALLQILLSETSAPK